jgi:polyhydroxybutyrate depolymerase
MPARATRQICCHIAALIAALLMLGGLGVRASAAEIQHIVVGGVKRSYAIHLPATATNRLAVPLVFVLHGAGGQGDQALNIYKWIAKADSEGFIVVAPDATRVNPELPPSFLYNPTVWNDGSGRGGDAIRASDDVALIDALIEHIASRYPIDRRRIYATGFSSGASMVQRLGVERAKVLAAIAPVAGHLWSGEVRPERGISVLYLVGNADPLVPYEGGRSVLPWGVVENSQPAKAVPQLWAGLDSCLDAPRPLEARPHVSAVVWINCRDRSEVVFYTIDGMGHQWPGGKRGVLPSVRVGDYSNAVDATDLIWAFFRRHSLN